MAREKVEFRDHLEQILIAFPDGELVNKKDAAKYLGVDARTFAKRFSMTTKNYISRTSLARQLSQ